MATLDLLIWHCTATPPGMVVTTDMIHKWHTLPKPTGRGWDRDGYADVLYEDATIHNLTPFNQDNIVDPWEVTWGARGVNFRSRHVVYVGGVREVIVEDKDGEVKTLEPYDTRTDAVKATMEVYSKYMIARHPKIKVAGHNQFSSKACPSFHMISWAESVGIPFKNIYYG